MASMEFKNNARSTVADNPLAAGATTLNVAPGEGTNFSSSFPFLITIWDSSPYPGDDSEMEIVKCTGRTVDALTIVRAQEGTADVIHSNGEKVAMLLTAGHFNDPTIGIITKLDTIEINAKDDQTGAEIKTLYEAEANAYTDTKNTKLAGIESAATVDQTKADIDALNIDADTVDGNRAGNEANKIPILNVSAILPFAQVPAIKAEYINKVPSDNNRISHDVVSTIYWGYWVKFKTITLTNGLKGKHRIKFEMKTGVAGSAWAEGQIRRNGVNIGTLRHTTETTYQLYSEDITQEWAAGDTCELWGKGNATNGYLQNFRIAYDNDELVIVVSSNS